MGLDEDEGSGGLVDLAGLDAHEAGPRPCRDGPHPVRRRGG